MNVQPPELSQSRTLANFTSAVRAKLDGGIVEKCVIYCPDAMGKHIYRAYPQAFKSLLQYAPIYEELHAVDPAVTPVCFASMFTGAPPEQHGIRKYERPV